MRDGKDLISSSPTFINLEENKRVFKPVETTPLQPNEREKKRCDGFSYLDSATAAVACKRRESGTGENLIGGKKLYAPSMHTIIYTSML